MAGTNSDSDKISHCDNDEKDTREKILDAAIDLFARKGFDTVTMQEIADAVSIKKASLYYHYTSKEEILEKILRYPNIRLASIQEDMGLQIDGSEERIVSMGLEDSIAMADDLSMRLMEDPRMEKIMRILYIELYRNDQVKQFYSRSMNYKHSMCTSLFATLRKHKLIKPYDPEMLAREYLSFYSDASTEYFLFNYGKTAGSFRQEYKERIEQHNAFIINALKP